MKKLLLLLIVLCSANISQVFAEENKPIKLEKKVK